MVMLGDWWPRSFMRTGKLTPARSISVPKECRKLVRGQCEF